MWRVQEHRDIRKISHKLPLQVLEKYDLWKQIIVRHGPQQLRELPGFHDEKLRGNREGERSSRLNLQYRVIYSVEQDTVTVFVIEITPHKY